MKRYEKYKQTDIEWIGEIPQHWEVKKLKYLALVQPSNVNKKSVDGETPVLLCNYMDVYKNNFIDSSIKFMEATATQNEIEKFILKKGDVLVTKDSETPDDIANPAYVVRNFENVICGYHLTQIRANKDLAGKYLFRLFQEHTFKAQFEVAANGVTRYALSVNDFADAFIPLPPYNEQTAIANYLDEKTAQIDTLIANKQRLIELLKEERMAFINEAVSGEGKNWENKKLSHGFKKIGSGTTPASGNDIYYNGTINWLQTGDLNDGEINSTNKKITEKAVEDYSSLREYPKGSLVIAMYGATIGKVGILNIATTTNQACCVLSEPTSFNIMFVFYWFLGNKDFIVSKSYGGGQPNISQELIRGLRLPCPTIVQQVVIVKNIQAEVNRIDSIISKIEQEIELMLEYRTALVSEILMGKIRVTDVSTVIEMPSKQVALAAEIMSQLYEEKSFGRVKFQKILYLCEYACNLEGMESNYCKAAAGPLDEELLTKIEKELKRLQWVDTSSSPSTKFKERINYSLMPKLNDYKKWYAKYWSGNNENIQHIIGLLRFANSENCEMIATLFAAWNDLIIKAYGAPSDSLIIKEVFEWHERKKRLTKEQWQKELDFMRKQNIIPKGFGKLTIA